MMVSINVLWLVVGGIVLIAVSVVSALRWNGRPTRGQHSFYAKEVSVRSLTSRASSSPDTVRRHGWPKTDRDEILARRRGTRS